MTIPPLIAAKGAANASQKVKTALSGDIYTRRWQSTKGKGKKKKTVDHELRVNAVSAAALAVAGAATVALGAMALWMTQRKLKPTDANKTIVRSVRLYEAVYKEETYTVVDTPAWDETVETVNTTWEVPDPYPTTVGSRCTLDGSEIYNVAYEEHLAAGRAAITYWHQLHDPHRVPGPGGTTSPAVVGIEVTYQPPGEWVTHYGTKVVHHDAVTHQATRTVLASAGRGVVRSARGIPIRYYTPAVSGGSPAFMVISPAERAKGYVIAAGSTPQVRTGEDQLGKYEESVFSIDLGKKGWTTADREGFSMGGLL